MTSRTAPLRVGIVGAGYWGPNLVRNFRALAGVTLAGVADRRPGRLQFMREKFADLNLVSDAETLLADETVDAMVLATPVSTHADLAVQAIERGKHVFIEKPMAPSVRDCDRIIEAAEKAGRRVAVGHIFVYHPAVVAMREAIAAGQIGRPCYTESARVNLGPPASEVNVLWDLLVHDLAIQLDVLGGRPAWVTAFGSRFLHPTLIDAAFVHVRMHDGTMASHHVSWLSPERVRRFFAAGSNGSLTFDDTRQTGKLRWVDQGEDSRIGTKDSDAKELFYKPGEVKELPLAADEPLASECRAFIDAIQDGRPLRNGGEQGRAVVAIIEAAERSLAAGSTAVAVSA